MGGMDPSLIWLGILIMAVVAGSGCLEALQEPMSTQEEAAMQAEPKGKNGDLFGIVVNSLGSPLSDAFVALLGTSESRTTGSDGRFEFASLAAGEYTLRVDRVMYLSHEALVSIVKHSTTEISVSMVPANGCEPHLHDYWGGNTALLLAELELAPSKNGTGTDPVLAAQGGVLDPTLGGANREIRLPKGTRVLPGTANLTAVLNWAQSPTQTFDHLGFAYKAADAKSAVRVAPKASGVPALIGVSEGMADPAHSFETSWKFYYYFPSGQGPNAALGTIQVKIMITKGVVPVDGSCAGHHSMDHHHA